MTQHPGQRHGRRIAAVLARDLAERGLAQQRPLSQRRIGHHHDLGLLAFRQQLPFDAARAQMVEHLVGDAVAAVGHAGQLVEVARVEVADAPAPDLAGLLQGLEGFDRLGQRMRAAPVQEVEVEPVGAEPLQAALAGGDGAFARGVVRIDLADEIDLVAQAPHGLADDLLGDALAVHLGRIDQPDAELEPQLDGGHLGRPLGLALAHAPSAQPEHRDLLACLERHGSHSAAPWLIVRPQS